MKRTLVEVKLPAGAIGLIVPWMDLSVMDWTELLQPLAGLLAHEPSAEWTFTPIPEDVSDKGALLGY